MDCKMARRARYRKLEIPAAPSRTSRSVPLVREINGNSVCLFATVHMNTLYTLIDTHDVQLYGSFSPEGHFDTLVLFAGEGSLLQPIPISSDTLLPMAVGGVEMKRKRGRVVVSGEGWKIAVTGDREMELEIVDLDSGIPGLLG